MADTKLNETNSTGLPPGHPYTITEKKVPVSKLRSHPDNTYEVTPEGVKALAENISEVGLLQPIIVRVVADGGLQLLSGHRRKAAFELLAKTNKEYEEIDARVYEGLSDADALLILHSSNITRSLSTADRKNQAELLKEQVANLREFHPEWKGVRTANIIANMLGMSVSSYKRSLQFSRDLIPELQQYYDNGIITVEKATELSKMPNEEQVQTARILDRKQPKTKKESTEIINEYKRPVSAYVKDVNKAITELDAAYFKLAEVMRAKHQITGVDIDRIKNIRDKFDDLISKITV